MEREKDVEKGERWGWKELKGVGSFSEMDDSKSCRKERRLLSVCLSIRVSIKSVCVSRRTGLICTQHEWFPVPLPRVSLHCDYTHRSRESYYSEGGKHMRRTCLM